MMADTGAVLHVGTYSGYYRFQRQADGWQAVNKSLSYWSASCLALDPEDQGSVYIGTEHSGLFISRDGGLSWARPSPNVPRLLVSSVLVAKGELLVGTAPAELYRFSGGSWREIEDLRHGAAGSSFPPSPDLGSRTRDLALDPRQPSRLYAGIEVGGMLVSDDGGETWQPANDGLSDPDVHQVRPSAGTRGLVFAACGEEGVFRSRDEGEHWPLVTPSGPRAYAAAVIEAGDGAVYASVTRGRPNTWVRPEGADAAIIWSEDGGGSWRPALEGMRGGVLDFCLNPDGAGVIAATSEGELIEVNKTAHKTIASGLPCITAVASVG
jgi:photosystem II stability/assembly factor-like uncharacterized protein